MFENKIIDWSGFNSCMSVPPFQRSSIWCSAITPVNGRLPRIEVCNWSGKEKLENEIYVVLFWATGNIPKYSVGAWLFSWSKICLHPLLMMYEARRRASIILCSLLVSKLHVQNLGSTKLIPPSKNIDYDISLTGQSLCDWMTYNRRVWSAAALFFARGCRRCRRLPFYVARRQWWSRSIQHRLQVFWKQELYTPVNQVIIGIKTHLEKCSWVRKRGVKR